MAKTIENKMYFTEEHERAIVRYNESNDADEREQLFRGIIFKGLDKIAENIINRFKAPYIHSSYDDLKRQIVSFLVCNLYRYTPDKGKAFSYFSVMTKNYLIFHNNAGYKQDKMETSFTEISGTVLSIDEIMSLEAVDARANDDTKEFVSLIIKFWDRNLTRIFKKDEDIKIAVAVIQLFRDVEGIENFKKKALYLMVREMTDCDTTSIKRIINKMKEYTYIQHQQFYNTGRIDTLEETYFSYDS